MCELLQAPQVHPERSSGSRPVGRQTTLSAEAEAAIERELIEAAEACRGLSIKQLCALARAMAPEDGPKFSASPMWVKGFRARHPDLAYWKTTATNTGRLKSLTREGWYLWHAKWKTIAAAFDPRGIINLDHKGWDLESTSKKVRAFGRNWGVPLTLRAHLP